MKKKKRVSSGNGSLSSLFLMIFGLVLVVVALIILVPVLWDYKKADDTYKDLNDQFVSIEGEITIEGGEDSDWWYKNVNIYLSELQSVNPDVIGWIRFDNIEIISYPVLYSGDNDSYLRTDIYGRDSSSGCIFMEAANSPDFNDCHTIIYGHNMKNLSMFGRLKDYKTEGFYEDNQFFTIYTNDMAYRYQIFAYADIPETDSVYTVGFAPDSEFQSFIDGLRRRSYIESDVTVTQNDKVLTLSTCSSTGNRFVVHAVRVDAHTYE